MQLKLLKTIGHRRPQKLHMFKQVGHRANALRRRWRRCCAKARTYVVLRSHKPLPQAIRRLQRHCMARHRLPGPMPGFAADHLHHKSEQYRKAHHETRHEKSEHYRGRATTSQPSPPVGTEHAVPTNNPPRRFIAIPQQGAMTDEKANATTMRTSAQFQPTLEV